MSSEERARVFISCGQQVDTDELNRAKEIEAALRSAGFEPYLAIAHQSLLALRENLFPSLTDAEYFLFIDFRREPIGTGYRGSLFSHQELAIASYLEIDFIGFQEQGVKREGLIGHLQSNCRSFSNREDLPALVLEEVRHRKWDPQWRNRLHVQLNTPPFADEQVTNGWGRFFHLRVTNRHRHRTARNCLAYIRSVTDNSTGEPIDFETVELKWAGYVLPTATIGPRSHRLLDGFWFSHADPKTPQFRCFADWSRAIPDCRGASDLTLTYEVASDSVPGSSASLRVILTDTLDGIKVDPQ